MSIGLLTVSARNVSISGETAEAHAEALAIEAANFLAAGGVVTLAEWSGLPDEERRALVMAHAVVDADRAKILAREILRGQVDPSSLFGGGA